MSQMCAYPRMTLAALLVHSMNQLNSLLFCRPPHLLGFACCLLATESDSKNSIWMGEESFSSTHVRQVPVFARMRNRKVAWGNITTSDASMGTYIKRFHLGKHPQGVVECPACITKGSALCTVSTYESPYLMATGRRGRGHCAQDTPFFPSEGGTQTA
ncbi:hypothetical protein EDD21DRAFT_233197 [Dissophora ornata]|nr:hypothetical protein EDD21DRAFT_233197 [Dissophora ornata]